MDEGDAMLVGWRVSNQFDRPVDTDLVVRDSLFSLFIVIGREMVPTACKYCGWNMVSRVEYWGRVNNTMARERMSGGTVVVASGVGRRRPWSMRRKFVRTMAGNSGKSPAVLSRLFYPYLLPPRTTSTCMMR